MPKHINRLIAYLLSVLFSFALSARAQTIPVKEVTPEIHSLSDLGGVTPIEFLGVLKGRQYSEYIFWTSLKNWITKKDIPALLALVDSKEPCSSVALSSSSYATNLPSTLGQEARFMLYGYRMGQYPPGLNSISYDDEGSRGPASNFPSPDKEYDLRLSDSSQPYIYTLSIFHRKHQIARYLFKGALVTAYWSPSGKYVAINNQCGDIGFYVWIISLTDGDIMRTTGALSPSDYNRYRDFDDLSDMRETAKDKLKSVYSDYDADVLGRGWASVAYGWLNGDRLLMFERLPFADLFDKSADRIQIYSTYDVNMKDGLGLIDVSVKRVPAQSEPLPTEVRKTLANYD